MKPTDLFYFLFKLEYSDIIPACGIVAWYNNTLKNNNIFFFIYTYFINLYFIFHRNSIILITFRVLQSPYNGTPGHFPCMSS